MSTITKEQIEMYASAADATQTFGMDKGKLICVEPEHMLELARIALASLEAEAVAYIRDGFRTDGVHFCGGIITAEEHERTKPALSDRYNWKHQPLYTAPPAPVVPEEAMPENIAILASTFAPHGVSYQWDRDECNAAADSWNACRAAMLQGKADAALKNEGTIPATQIKPVADLYGISAPGGRTTTYSTDAAEASDCRVMGWSVQEYVKLERYQSAMLQGAENVESPTTMHTAPALDSSPKIAESTSGNSPVIPDGWALVPIEPTEDMIVNGFESEPDESFSDEKEWKAYDAMSGCQQSAHRAKLCWAAMIAAAPQQEVK